jgi:hypothetical protein
MITSRASTWRLTPWRVFARAVGRLRRRLARSGRATSGNWPHGLYAPRRDSHERPSVAKGSIQFVDLPRSTVYAGYSHKAWLYLPPRRRVDEALPLMVFQDGEAFMVSDGAWRVPTVFDNLISDGGLPPLAVVFLNPGVAERDDGLASEQRSLEYDSLSDAYATFLISEVFPAIEKMVPLIDAPAAKGIAGLSSGGICAFNAAWRRPDVFSKVFSAIGSFVDIRGGGAYPDLIRTADRKPLRIFLQAGVHDSLPGKFADLDWPAASRAMARALALKYEFQFVMGRGNHSSKHGAAISPPRHALALARL